MPKDERAIPLSSTHLLDSSSGSSSGTPHLGISDLFTSNLAKFISSSSKINPFGTVSVTAPASDLVYARSESGRAVPASKSDPLITKLASTGQLNTKKVKDTVKDLIITQLSSSSSSGDSFSDNFVDIQVTRSHRKDTPDHLTITVTVAVPPIVLESVGIFTMAFEGLDNNCTITCPDSWRIDIQDGSRVLLGGETYTQRKWNMETNSFDLVVKTVPDTYCVHQTGLFAFSNPVPVTKNNSESFKVVPTRSIKTALDVYQSTLFKQGISTMIIHNENYPEPGQFTIVVTENKRFGKVNDISL